MRLFFSLALIGLFTSFSAQETLTYPYNPDGDVDGAIASPDLLDLLGVYSNAFTPTEIQIDGVGLLQVIQYLQNQLGALQGQILDANYVESTFTAHQQEIDALQDEIATLNQQIAENTLPDGTDSGQVLIWNGIAWIPSTPIIGLLLDDENIQEAVNLWLSDESQAVDTYGHISSWDVSSVTDMSYMFEDASNFNGDISAWGVSNVTDMSSMFRSADSFNGDLSSWDVSSVTDMSMMFKSADSFNGDLSSWDVSSVINMSYMFSGASLFNGDISSWDVLNVTDMSKMFANASSFNGDLLSWDVSSVTNMDQMFSSASLFNGDLSSWNVSSVTNMFIMFFSAESFNGDLSSWDVSSVTNMNQMFDYASALSAENRCLIHTSFSSNSNWPYAWSGYCD